MKKLWLCLMGIMLAIVGAQAQDYPNEIYASISNERPLGDLDSVFKSTISYQVGYRRYLNEKVSMSLTTGFMSFRPTEEFVELDGFGASTLKLGNLVIIPLLYGLEYHILPKMFNAHADDEFVPMIGIEAGYFYAYQSAEIESAFLSSSSRSLQSKVVFAPKTALDFNVSNHLGLFAQAKLNFMLSTGQSSQQLNSGVTVTTSFIDRIDTFLSLGGGARYRF